MKTNTCIKNHLGSNRVIVSSIGYIYQNNISYALGGTTAIAGPTGKSDKAFTIGHYFMGPKNYQATWKDHLFVHEYGHYIQSQQWGPAYIYSIGAPSLVSATIARMNSNYNHSSKWFEIDASTKGAKYFDKKYGPTSSYSNNHDNIFDINVFKNGGYSPYYNPRLGKYFQDKHFIIQ